MTFCGDWVKNLDKNQRFDFVINFIKKELDKEDDKIALMANISSVIMTSIEDLNWVGFYLVKANELVLGPFQGLPATTRLTKDKGVCAKSWREKKLVRVDDVHEFEDHVACDSSSNSELVLPLIYKNEVYGVLDIDSSLKSRFTNFEEDKFSQIINLIQDKLYILN